MSYERWNLFVTMLLTLVSFAAAQNQGLCSNNGNYSRNSPYSTNLNTLLSSLSSNIDAYGFHNASFGANPNRAYVLALCRADQTLDQCRTCIQNAAVQVLQVCPNQLQAIIWYDYCMLRYSNKSMYGIPAIAPPYVMYNSANGSRVDQFREDRTRLLLADLRVQAAGGGPALKAGAGKASPGTRNLSDSETLYGLVQCTPDLSMEDCDDCLTRAAQPSRGFDWRGMRMMLPSCNIRYELYLFYNEARLRQVQVLPPAPPGNDVLPPATGTSADNLGRKKDDNTTKIVIIVVVPIAVCLIMASCAVFFMRKRIKWRWQQNLQDGVDTDEISTLESLQHDFGEISAATNDFADANKLGKGGFGAVYVGRLADGQQIAVKRLSRGSGQGNVEFKNEVLLVAKLQHRNLVRLLGFSRKGTERLLIYEFVQNASLDHFLFDPIKSSSLDWDRRYKIIVGIARGLVYLHEDSRLRIIHRDLKPSNVLLDGNMNPKIADFGMARLFGQDETEGSTNRIVGTYGYMSPEYAMHGQFSVKSDVFSFGVLVLEIISGQKNNCLRDGEDLLTFAWKNWHEGTGQNMLDPVLRAGEGGSVREMLRCVHIGLLCVQEHPADRPTMTSVLLMLNSSTISLQVPSKPAFFMAGSSGPDVSLFQEYDSNTSVVDANIASVNYVTVTDLYPR